MNAPLNPPPAPKKGMSGLAIAGIGCGALFLLSGVAGGLLVMKGCQKIKQVAGELENNPGKAAVWALKLNPDIDVINENDAKGEVTYKDKKSGEVVTISYDDLSKGKVTITNGKGETVSMDASNAEKEGIVVNGPDGKMVVGGAQSSPPAWVPVYPGATAAGGMKTEKGETVAGSYTVASTDPSEKVQEYYVNKLKEEGYEVTNTTTQSDNSPIIMITGTKEEGKRSVTTIVQKDGDKTQVAITYGFDPSK